MRNLEIFATTLLLFLVTSAAQAAHPPHPELDLAARQARSRAASIMQDTEIYFRHAPSYRTIVKQAAIIRSIANDIVRSPQLPSDYKRLHEQFDIMEDRIDVLQKLTAELHRFPPTPVRHGHRPPRLDRHRHHHAHAAMPLNFIQAVRHINNMTARLHDASHDVDRGIHSLKHCRCAYCQRGGRSILPPQQLPDNRYPQQPYLKLRERNQNDRLQPQYNDLNNRPLLPPVPEKFVKPQHKSNGPQLLPPSPSASRSNVHRTAYSGRTRSITLGGVRITLSE